MPDEGFRVLQVITVGYDPERESVKVLYSPEEFPTRGSVRAALLMALRQFADPAPSGGSSSFGGLLQQFVPPDGG